MEGAVTQELEKNKQLSEEDDIKQELIAFLDETNAQAGLIADKHEDLDVEEEAKLRNELASSVKELDMDDEYEKVIRQEERRMRRLRKKEVNLYEAALSVGGIGFGAYLIKQNVLKKTAAAATRTPSSVFQKGFGVALIVMNALWLKENFGW